MTQSLGLTSYLPFCKLSKCYLYKPHFGHIYIANCFEVRKASGAPSTQEAECKFFEGRSRNELWPHRPLRAAIPTDLWASVGICSLGHILTNFFPYSDLNDQALENVKHCPGPSEAEDWVRACILVKGNQHFPCLLCSRLASPPHESGGQIRTAGVLHQAAAISLLHWAFVVRFFWLEETEGAT